jgi:NADPH-dependent 2,4-dienoyl-CoA reductase/sulfur reductase-like enzyme
VKRIVIVGASTAGLTAAETLRRRGWDGRLTLIGEESRPPYDRPPLSKQILTGAWGPERATLRSLPDLARLRADLRLGQRAVALDVPGRRVRLGGGESIGFDALVIATGVAPRRLPDSDLAGVHVLRSLDDAIALRAALRAGPRVVVVGAGFLGTEVAAAARAMGLDVTVAEPEPVPVRRPFGDRIGALVAALHRDHGTRLRSATAPRCRPTSSSWPSAPGPRPSGWRVRACGWETGWGATRIARRHPGSTPPATSPPGPTRTSAPACGWSTG